MVKLKSRDRIVSRSIEVNSLIGSGTSKLYPLSTRSDKYPLSTSAVGGINSDRSRAKILEGRLPDKSNYDQKIMIKDF